MRKAEIEQALECDEFLLFYQPLVEIGSERIIGSEALLRWKRSGFGLTAPMDFIPLAEETGLIVPIGEHVIGEACTQTKAWQEAGFAQLSVTVNIAAKQLRPGELAHTVAKAINDNRLDPSCLELEFTESALTAGDGAARTVLSELRDTGIRLSLDDFGGGSFTPEDLNRFHIDKLKIARRFINGMLSDPGDAMIVKAVIALAHKLDLQVVAKGVETSEQEIFLKQQDADCMQGFLFSAPLSGEDFTSLLKGRRFPRLAA